jgi:hypothetical protein
MLARPQSTFISRTLGFGYVHDHVKYCGPNRQWRYILDLSKIFVGEENYEINAARNLRFMVTAVGELIWGRKENLCQLFWDNMRHSLLCES